MGRRRISAHLSLGLCCLVALGGIADRARADGARAGEQVRIDRVRPEGDSPKTLRFLEENRAFLRGQLDLLRVRPNDEAGRAAEIDPRWLRYDALLAEIAATPGAPGSSDAADWLEQLQALLELEAELDSLDAALDAQATRLAEMESDFATRAFTSLSLLLRGTILPDLSALHFGAVDGVSTRVPLEVITRSSLDRGGVAEAWRELVEPRDQVFVLSFEDPAGRVGAPFYLSLSPQRGGQNLLELDLATLASTEPTARLSVLVDRGAQGASPVR